jgi:prepilin-type N-terminal cleavage/methylation domain-containing protein
MEKLALRPNNKAFSLLELVVAIAIISVGIVFVIQALGFTAKASAVVSNYLRASLLAEDRIQGLEFAEAQQIIGEENSLEKNGNFDILTKISFDDKFGLYQLGLKINWPESKRTEGFELSAYYRK